MKKLNQLLPAILQQLPADPEIRLIFLQRLWQQIVGREVAARCRPEAIRGSELVIRATSDQWQLPLQEWNDLLVASIHRVWAGSGIDRISILPHLKRSP